MFTRTSTGPFLSASTRSWRRHESPGMDLVLVVYLLFAASFLLHVTAFIGILLAYYGRGRASPLARSHLDRVIAFFWTSLLILVSIAVLHLAIVGLGALTFGFGLVLMVLPWGLGIGWLVWAIWEIGTGLFAAWRREPV